MARGLINDLRMTAAFFQSLRGWRRDQTGAVVVDVKLSEQVSGGSYPKRDVDWATGEPVVVGWTEEELSPHPLPDEADQAEAAKEGTDG